MQRDGKAGRLADDSFYGDVGNLTFSDILGPALYRVFVEAGGEDPFQYDFEHWDGPPEVEYGADMPGTTIESIIERAEDVLREPIDG